MNELDMKVVVAKCSRTKKLLGISLKQEKPGEWIAYWAFPLSEADDRREGYSQTRVTGIIIRDWKYPGCPYCGNDSFFGCGVCKNLSCWNSKSPDCFCGFCEKPGKVTGSSEFDVSASHDG